jgi:competence protein ComEA
MRRLSQLILALLAATPLALYADPVNVNSADVSALAQALEGIGEAKAKAIVAYRQQHGPFKSVDEVGLVKGIGPKLLDRNRANIRLGPATAAGAKASAPAVRTAPGVRTTPAVKSKPSAKP